MAESAERREEREQIELYVIRVDLCVPVEAVIRPSDSARSSREPTTNQIMLGFPYLSQETQETPLVFTQLQFFPTFGILNRKLELKF